MNIAKAIVQVLLEDGKVYLPGLGQLERTFHSSELFRHNNKLTPPQYTLMFTKETTAPEKSLSLFISSKEDLGFEETEHIVSEFVQSLKVQLKKGREVTLPEIGIFRSDGKTISFEPESESELLADTAGFESVYIDFSEKPEKTVQANTKEDLRPMKKETSFIRKKIVLIVAAVIIVVGGIFALLFISGDNDTVDYDSSLARINKRNALLYIEKPATTVETVIDTPEVAPPPAKTQQRYGSVNTNFTHFYIVAGSFKSQKNAERMKTKLEEEGFKPEILSVGDSIFRVTMMSFMQRDSALTEWRRLMSEEENSGLWLLME